VAGGTEMLPSSLEWR